MMDFEACSDNLDLNRKGTLYKRTGNFVKALILSLAISSCESDYPNNEYNFCYDSNTDKIEGYYNIRFNHSQGSAWYSIDSYNISLTQNGTTYTLKINDDNFKVKSPEDAKSKICNYIAIKKEWFVHEKYLKKADDKTADFMEQYKEYSNDQDRAPEKSVKLKDGKVQKQS